MKVIRELIIHLSKEKNKTIFLSSHILYEVELVATRMIILNKGTTQVEGYGPDLLNASELKVTFRVDDKEKAFNLIKETKWNEKIETRFDEGFIFILSPEEIPLLNKYFVENDIPVNAVIPLRSLEEYFLRLTDQPDEKTGKVS
jgi:ABC-2 type transport system ATP-binding protein